MRGYSPIFGTAYTSIVDHSPNTRQLFRWGRQNKLVRELLDELIGAAAGATAAVTVKRVPSNVAGNFGKVVLETRTIINRATTAADRTNLRNFFSEDSKIATPTNKAGTAWRA